MTKDMNVILSSEFQALEVENALKHMAPLKAAAGPNRILPLFIRIFGV